MRGLFGFIFQGFLQSCLCSIFIKPELTDLTFQSYILIGVFVLSLLGETISDIQLENFKAQKSEGETKETICKTGLWSISRHPNYFFDFMCWVSFAGFIISTSILQISSCVALFGPFTMWFIFRHITGPLTEKHSVKRRGEDYKKYQKEVPMIIPFLDFLNYP